MAATLEDQINRFNKAREELDEAIRASHEVLSDIRRERREIERLLRGKEVKKLVNDRVDEVVRTELEKIGPEVRRQTSLIYEKVGREMDKLIDLSLGEEFARSHGRESVRPQLAEKLKEWLRETIDTEGA